MSAFGDFLGVAVPALNWLGYGARPYPYAEGAPGTYYTPSRHPYQATLSDGLKVQEAYPGQYYVPRPGMAGLGEIKKLPYKRWVCAIVGALALGASGYGGTYYYAKKNAMTPKKKKNLPLQVAAGTALAGAVAGWWLCAQTSAAPPPPPAPAPTLSPQVFPIPSPAPPVLR